MCIRDSLNSAAKNWFAAAFHRGIAFSRLPSDSGLYWALRESHANLASTNRGAIQYLPTVVRKSIGAKPIGPTESEALAINSRFWTPMSSKAISSEHQKVIADLAKIFPRGALLRTKSVGEYRSGRYQAAAQSLSDALDRISTEEELPGPHPVDLALLAMSYLKLSEVEKAAAFRKELVEVMKTDRYKDDKESRRFHAEAEKLFNEQSKADGDETDKNEPSESSKSSSKSP